MSRKRREHQLSFRRIQGAPIVDSIALLGLFVGFEFVNQPHFLLNYAINDVSYIPARSICEVLNLIL